MQHAVRRCGVCARVMLIISFDADPARWIWLCLVCDGNAQPPARLQER